MKLHLHYLNIMPRRRWRGMLTQPCATSLIDNLRCPLKPHDTIHGCPSTDQKKSPHRLASFKHSNI